MPQSSRENALSQFLHDLARLDVLDAPGDVAFRTRNLSDPVDDWRAVQDQMSNYLRLWGQQALHIQFDGSVLHPDHARIAAIVANHLQLDQSLELNLNCLQASKQTLASFMTLDPTAATCVDAWVRIERTETLERLLYITVAVESESCDPARGPDEDFDGDIEIRVRFAQLEIPIGGGKWISGRSGPQASEGGSTSAESDLTSIFDQLTSSLTTTVGA